MLLEVVSPRPDFTLVSAFLGYTYERPVVRVGIFRENLVHTFQVTIEIVSGTEALFAFTFLRPDILAFKWLGVAQCMLPECSLSDILTSQ